MKEQLKKMPCGREPVKGKITSGKSGWAVYNYPKSEECKHCVSVCGYGLLDDLISEFKRHDVVIKKTSDMPNGMWYAVFTWNSIGIIDEQSLLNMAHAAWVRDPVTPAAKLPRVSEFKLENDGGFYADIHAIYHSTSPHTTPNMHEVANKILLFYIQGQWFLKTNACHPIYNRRILYS